MAFVPDLIVIEGKVALFADRRDLLQTQHIVLGTQIQTSVAGCLT